MTITDLYGTKIFVANLNQAIKEAKAFSTYAHLESTPQIRESDQQRQEYWKDIYEKLKEIKSQLAK